MKKKELILDTAKQNFYFFKNSVFKQKLWQIQETHKLLMLTWVSFSQIEYASRKKILSGQARCLCSTNVEEN